MPAPLFDVLAPLGADLVLVLEDEAGTRERGLDPPLVEVPGHVPEVAVEQRGVLQREPVGREGRVHEHAPAASQHAERLGEGAVEIVDLLEHVAAPHEVEVGVGERELLERADADLDTLGDSRGVDRRTRPLDVHLDRIDTGAGDLVALDERDQVRRVATAGVEDPRACGQVAAGQVVERVGPARRQALVEHGVDAPRLLAVDPIEPRAIAGLHGRRAYAPIRRRPPALRSRGSRRRAGSGATVGPPPSSRVTLNS